MSELDFNKMWRVTGIETAKWDFSYTWKDKSFVIVKKLQEMCDKHTGIDWSVLNKLVGDTHQMDNCNIPNTYWITNQRDKEIWSYIYKESGVTIWY